MSINDIEIKEKVRSEIPQATYGRRTVITHETVGDKEELIPLPKHTETEGITRRLPKDLDL